MQAVQKGYLLPLKKAFFDYFDTDFLTQTLKDGGKVLEIKVDKTDAVIVKLRIPIQNDNYITFERMYHTWVPQTGIPVPDEIGNKGYIVERQIGFSIFPMVKTGNPEQEAPYRAILVDRDILDTTRGNNYQVAFFQNKNNTELKVGAERQRSDKHKGDIATTKIYILDREFDYIQVDSGTAKGIIVPFFITNASGFKQFSFAIDFGATNTHIEYQTADSPSPQPFEISRQDMQVGCLGEYAFFDRDRTVNNTRATALFEIQRHLMPEKIGLGQNFRFPQRTVLYENPSADFNKTVFALADFHIPFDYGKLEQKFDSEIHADLKWSNIAMSISARKRVQAYLEQLVFMIRAKVLLNGGSLEKTKLIWFYPTDMTPASQDELNQLWKELYRQYIGTEESSVIAIPESLTPFYYYRSNSSIVALHPVVCINIGSQTTDVVIFKEEHPVLVTSFQFVANTMYGDAYADTGGESNGFVLRYEQKIRSLLESNNLNELLKVLDSIRKEQRSEDIVTFFFSLENNTDVTAKKIDNSFRDLLIEDADMKIVFILFYTAMMYHIASLMAAKKMPYPSFVTFSGNGAKSLSFIGSQKLLENFTRIIFEKVYQKFRAEIEKNSFKDGLTIFHQKESKEVICKGGLLMNLDKDIPLNIEQLKSTLLGTPDLQIAEEVKIRYNDENQRKILLSQVETEVLSFIDFAIDLNHDFSFRDYFGASVKNLEKYREELKRYTEDFIAKGLKLRLEEIEDKNQIINETLFFYPLVAALNRLAYFVQQNSSLEKI
jgi:hypothetical protein